MQKSYNLYHNLGFWFLSLLVLVIAGFYTTYLSVIFQPKAALIHVHFILEFLWILMLITQPFLIKYKQRALHRTLGKISYVLVPLVVVTNYIMIRFSYYNVVADMQQKAMQGLNQLNNDQILQQAATFMGIGIFWLLMFISFYCLAIINRRNSAAHARYMVASALSLLGPTVDRIVYYVFKLEKLPGSIPIETVAFFIADIVLAFLLWKDYKNKRPIKTLWISLLIYVTGEVLYFLVPGTSGWQHIISFIMKPGL